MERMGFTPADISALPADRVAYREEPLLTSKDREQKYEHEKAPERAKVARQVKEALDQMDLYAKLAAGQTWAQKLEATAHLQCDDISGVTRDLPAKDLPVMMKWAFMKPRDYAAESELQPGSHQIDQINLQKGLIDKLYGSEGGSSLGQLLTSVADNIDLSTSTGPPPNLVDAVKLEDNANPGTLINTPIQKAEAKKVIAQALNLIALNEGPEVVTELLKALAAGHGGTGPANARLVNAGLLNRYLKEAIKLENARRSHAGTADLTVNVGTLTAPEKRQDLTGITYSGRGSIPGIRTKLVAFINRTDPIAGSTTARPNEIYSNWTKTNILKGIDDVQDDDVKNHLTQALNKRGVTKKKGIKEVANIIRQLDRIANAPDHRARLKILEESLVRDPATGLIRPDRVRGDGGKALGKDIIHKLRENLTPRSFESQALAIQRLALEMLLDSASKPAGVDQAIWEQRLKSLITSCGFEEDTTTPNKFTVKKENVNLPAAMGQLLRLTDGATATDRRVIATRQKIQNFSQYLAVAQIFGAARPGGKEYFDAYFNAANNGAAAKAILDQGTGDRAGQFAGDMSKREVQRLKNAVTMVNDLDQYFKIINIDYSGFTDEVQAELRQQLSDLTEFVNADPSANPLDFFRKLRGEAEVAEVLQSEAIEEALLGHPAENTAEEQEIKDILAMSETEPEGPLAFMKKTWKSISGFMKRRGLAAGVSALIGATTAVFAVSNPIIIGAMAGVMLAIGAVKMAKTMKKAGGFKAMFQGYVDMFKEQPGIATVAAIAGGVASFIIRTFIPGAGLLWGTTLDLGLVLGGELAGTVAQKRLRKKCQELATLYKNNNHLVKKPDGKSENVNIQQVVEKMLDPANRKDADVDDTFWSIEHSHFNDLTDVEKIAWAEVCNRRAEVQTVRNGASKWLTAIAFAQAGSALGTIAYGVSEVTGLGDTLRGKFGVGKTAVSGGVKTNKPQDKGQPGTLTEAPPETPEVQPGNPILPEGASFSNGNTMLNIPVRGNEAFAWADTDRDGMIEFWLTGAGGPIGAAQGQIVQFLTQNGIPITPAIIVQMARQMVNSSGQTVLSAGQVAVQLGIATP